MHVSVSVNGIALILHWPVNSIFPKDCRGQWWFQLWKDYLIFVFVGLALFCFVFLK